MTLIFWRLDVSALAVFTGALITFFGFHCILNNVCQQSSQGAPHTNNL